MSEEESQEGNWTKGGGGFGPVKRGSKRLGISMPTGEAGKPTRLKVGDKALLEIERFQRDGGYLIPKVAFLRLVREIFERATKKTMVTRMERSAVEALQMMAEAHIALTFNSK
jgi:histone H3/H4